VSARISRSGIGIIFCNHENAGAVLEAKNDLAYKSSNIGLVRVGIF
jgi:hypothetical protein